MKTKKIRITYFFHRYYRKEGRLVKVRPDRFLLKYEVLVNGKKFLLGKGDFRFV